MAGKHSTENYDVRQRKGKVKGGIYTGKRVNSFEECTVSKS